MRRNTSHLPSTLVPAGASTWLTVDNFLTLASALLNGVGDLSAMWQHQVDLPPHNPLGLAMGLGVFIDEWDGTAVLGHAGGTSGYTANAVGVPDADATVVFLGNCRGNAAWPALRDLVFRDLLGMTPRATPSPMADPPPATARFAGRYLRRGQDITITVKGNDFVSRRGTSESRLIPINDRTFVEMPQSPHPAVVHFPEAADGEFMYAGVRALRRT